MTIDENQGPKVEIMATPTTGQKEPLWWSERTKRRLVPKGRGVASTPLSDRLAYHTPPGRSN